MTTQLRWSGIASMIGGLVFPFTLLLHPTRATGTSSQRKTQAYRKGGRHENSDGASQRPQFRRMRT